MNETDRVNAAAELAEAADLRFDEAVDYVNYAADQPTSEGFYHLRSDGRNVTSISSRNIIVNIGKAKAYDLADGVLLLTHHFIAHGELDRAINLALAGLFLLKQVKKAMEIQLEYQDGALALAMYYVEEKPTDTGTLLEAWKRRLASNTTFQVDVDLGKLHRSLGRLFSLGCVEAVGKKWILVEKVVFG